MPSNQYLMGPAIALAAVGVLSFVLRWIYADPPRRRRLVSRAVSDGAQADYGLLVPVATIADQSSAVALQQLLSGHGIRTTLAPAAGGGVAVLVFEADEGQARALLAPSG